MKSIHRHDRFTGAKETTLETKKLLKKQRSLEEKPKKEIDTSRTIRSNKAARRTLTCTSFFRSSSEIIHHHIVSEIQNANSIQPVKNVTDEYSSKPLEKADDKTRAKLLARKYFCENYFLKKMARQVGALSKSQCEMIFKIVAEIKQKKGETK